MKAKITEVCVGMPRQIEVGSSPEQSAIFKLPVTGPVNLGLTNLEGDGQANLKFHGGREKAVYVYSSVYYDYWRKGLQRDQLEASQFGQNLTVDGFPDDEVCIGDQFKLGTAVLTVAQPRIPCAKLAVRVGEADFTNKFLMAGKLGYYLYADEPGVIQQGDEITLLHKADHGVTVARLWQTTFTQEKDLELAAMAMEFPHVDEGWKKRLRQLLK